MNKQTYQPKYYKFGAFLKEQRIKNNLYQKDISHMAGLDSPQFISNIESGIALPSMRVWAVMCEAYKIKKSLIEEVRPLSSMDKAERRNGKTKRPRRTARTSLHKS